MKSRGPKVESPAVEAAPPSSAASLCPVTYEGLCKAPICFHRGDPDWHVCWCGAPAVEHAHVISRAQAPSKKRDPDNIVALCRRHHDAVDRDHTHGHAVKVLGDGLLHYFYWQSTPYKELADRVVGEGDGPKEAPLEIVSSEVDFGAGRRYGTTGRRAQGGATGHSVVGEGDGETRSRSNCVERPDRPSPVSLSAHILVPDNAWIERQALEAQEGQDANRETPTGMHGETVQPGEETEHGEDEALPKDAGGECPALHDVDGGAAAQWLPPSESELDGAGLGSASAREPGPASGTGVLAPSQIGSTQKNTGLPPDVSYEATGLVLRDGLPTCVPQHIIGGKFVDVPVSYEALGDEELAILYADADRRQRDGFLDKCAVIYAYRERHVQTWGESWTEQAYELFEGAPSRRPLYAYANIGQIISDASDTSLVEHIGPLTDSRSLMQFIGRKTPQAGAVALEAAVSYVAEYGEPPTVSALTHKLGVEREPKVCEHEWVERCRKCGVTG